MLAQREDKLNNLAGARIFLNDGDANLTSQSLGGGWRLESSGGGKTSFRQYLMGQVSSLGASVFSRNAIFSEDLLNEIVVVFANRGDFIGSATKLNLAIRQDYSALESGLTSLIGAGVPHVDRGGGIGESGKKWTYKNIDIFLTQQSGVYVRLRFSVAGEGRGKRTLDKDVRNLNTQRIEKRVNGDVVLSDFPMIDQGNKGYCVPASWARVLQFMGIDADMYSLGAASLSEAGGTDIFKAAGVGAEAAKSGGRRVSFPNLKPTVREVSFYIDRGIPVLWTMNYSEDFADAGNSSSGQPRQSVGNLKRALGQPHICILIGYNNNTGEIAVTDSWGISHQEKWYKDGDAKDVSLGKFYAVEY